MLYFVSKAIMVEASQSKYCLQLYKNASGQKINFSKSAVSFSPNTAADVRLNICSILQVPEVDNHGTYLGMASVIGRDKCLAFNYVVEKVTKRLQGWKAKVLSKAGKDVLLRTVT